jgi:hypothetical protein
MTSNQTMLLWRSLGKFIRMAQPIISAIAQTNSIKVCVDQGPNSQFHSSIMELIVDMSVYLGYDNDTMVSLSWYRYHFL